MGQVLSKMIEYGGPLLYHGGEDQQRSFDSTCRKFRRFLIETLADARRHPQIPPTRQKRESQPWRICGWCRHPRGMWRMAGAG